MPQAGHGSLAGVEPLCFQQDPGSLEAPRELQMNPSPPSGQAQSVSRKKLQDSSSLGLTFRSALLLSNQICPAESTVLCQEVAHGAMPIWMAPAKPPQGLEPGSRMGFLQQFSPHLPRADGDGLPLTVPKQSRKGGVTPSSPSNKTRDTATLPSAH